MPRPRYFIISFFLFAIFVGVFVYVGNRPPQSRPQTKVFTINQGDSLLSVARRLKTNGLIASEAGFLLNSYLLGLNRKIQSGTFYLSTSQTARSLIIRLSKGGSQDYWLKVKDGWRTEEIAQNLPPDSTLSSDDFLAAAASQEGYLFPDSYLVPRRYTAPQVVDLLKSNFQQKLTLASTDSTNNHLTDPFDLLILASLLEREGKSRESKQMISGILVNRLSSSPPMLLQVDATVQYARDRRDFRQSNLSSFSFWQPVTKPDLAIASPFNTYQNLGLPPSPICNPGFDSLFAAYHPLPSDYFYYITGKDGKMYYAKTLEEHNANISKYLR